MGDPEVFAALASPRRLQVLEWLKDPRAHFPPQRDGDLVDDGVCVCFIAEKLGVAQPTATAHMQRLARAGLVTSRRIGQWTFYRRGPGAAGTIAGSRQLHAVALRSLKWYTAAPAATVSTAMAEIPGRSMTPRTVIHTPTATKNSGSNG